MRKSIVASRVVLLFMVLAFVNIGGCGRRADVIVLSTYGESLQVLEYDGDLGPQEVPGSPADTGTAPSDVVYDPRHDRIYVANSGENTISAFEFNQQGALSEWRRIDVVGEPVCLAVDTRRDQILVLNRQGKLRRIASRDLSLGYEHSVFYALNPTPDPTGLAYSAADDLIYIVDGASANLLVLEGEDCQLVKVVATDERPSGLAFDHRNNRVYVISSTAHTLCAFAGGRHCARAQSVGYTMDGPYDVAYDPGQDVVMLATPNGVHVYGALDLLFKTQVGSQLLPQPVSMRAGVTQGRALLYVADEGDVDPPSLKVYEISTSGQYHLLPGSSLQLRYGPTRVVTTEPRCPEIASLTPQEGAVGDVVIIVGTSFGSRQGHSTLQFGTTTASVEDVVSWSDTQIQVRVPQLAGSGPVRVIRENRCSAPPDGEYVEPFTVVGRHIYVSAQDGSDYASGSQWDPYKTITRALDEARASDVVHVSWGRYTRELGERFPLQVPAGVCLTGEPHTPRVAVYDLSGDTAAIELNDRACLKKFEVLGSEQLSPNVNALTGIGVKCRGESSVEQVGVAGFATGIYVDQDQRAVPVRIKDCASSWNDTGIVTGSHVLAEITYCSAFQNNLGILTIGDSNFLGMNTVHDNKVGIQSGGRSTFLMTNVLNHNNDPTNERLGMGIQGGAVDTFLCHGNQVQHSFIGMQVVTLGRYVLSNNNIIGCSTGILLVGYEPALLLENRIEHNSEFGVRLQPEPHRIERNWINKNGVGMRFFDEASSDEGPEVVGNWVIENEQDGIDVSNGNPVHIGMFGEVGNTITGNGVGVRVSGTGTAARLFHNTLEDNRVGVLAGRSAAVWLGYMVGDYPMAGQNYVRDNTQVGLLCAEGTQTVLALGNWWNPNVQGSDVNGEYAHQTVTGPVPVVDGNNYAISGDSAIEF